VGAVQGRSRQTGQGWCLCSVEMRKPSERVEIERTASAALTMVEKVRLEQKDNKSCMKTQVCCSDGRPKHMSSALSAELWRTPVPSLQDGMNGCSRGVLTRKRSALTLLAPESDLPKLSRQSAVRQRPDLRRILLSQRSWDNASSDGSRPSTGPGRRIHREHRNDGILPNAPKL